jgi:hypothetical protein
MDTILIRQPAGLGDILFTFKIAIELNKKYNPKQILWPVVDQYIDLPNYIEVPENIHFISQSTAFPNKEIYETYYRQIIKQDNFIYIPLDYSCHSIYGEFNFQENLYSKYKFVNLSFSDWSSYIKLKRNFQKENELYNIKVGKKPYILVNRNYGTWPGTITRNDIVLSSEFDIVEMNFTEGYNIFDWIKILENAEEIHTLQTSLAYIVDILKLEKVYIYQRTQEYEHLKGSVENSFNYCTKIHNPNWIFESPAI